MIKAIFFDYGGVLTEQGKLGPFFAHCEKKYGKKIDEINDQAREIWEKARIGEIDSQLYWEFLGKYFEADRQQLLSECIEIDSFRQDTFEFIKSLKAKYKLGIISNQIQSWFELVSNKYEIGNVFEYIITSYNSGLAKPDKEIFVYASLKLGVRPEECIFVDDMPANIQAAKEVGMNAILYENLEKLKEDFNIILKEK